MARTLFATLVGKNAYKSPVPRLNGCVNDVNAMADMLRTFGGETDFEVSLNVLTNAEATRANVITGLREHLGQAGAG